LFRFACPSCFHDALENDNNNGHLSTNMVNVLISLLLLLQPPALVAAKQHGWTEVRRASPEAIIHLHIGVKASSGQRYLERRSAEIASPGSASYRQHLSASDLQSLLAPAKSTADQVQSWLYNNGDKTPSSTSQRGNIIEVTTTIVEAERLLNTTYSVYTDGVTNIVRSQEIHLPCHVRPHIEFVSPTDSFPEPVKLTKIPTQPKTILRRQSSDNGTCGADDYTTPSCVRSIYNITYTAEPNRTSFGVYATEAASFDPNDLQKFLQTYNKPAADAYAQYEVVGTGDPANGEPGLESRIETALGTQTALGLAWPARGILYNLGGVFGPTIGETYDPFVRFLQDLMHNETVPTVVVFTESVAENRMNEDYARSLCTMFQNIGARGVSLVFSSGNNGAQGDQPTEAHAQIFEPKFPASCPYVTSVGGTTDMSAETAATQSTITGAINKAGFTASGGGFSNYFSRPSYQDNAVPAYISDHVPDSYRGKSGFNASGRGIPDVSAFSTNCPVSSSNLTLGIGGTSGAAPRWAAVITLLNDYEASKGRPPLGFINPWLYSLSNGALKDITTGGNNSGLCAPNSNCTLPETPGYGVAAGWDPVTGLGSPVFNRLIEALDAQAGNSSSGNGTSGGQTGSAGRVRVSSWALALLAGLVFYQG
jgi:tripeptidyl-peptidase-1